MCVCAIFGSPCSTNLHTVCLLPTLHLGAHSHFLPPWNAHNNNKLSMWSRLFGWGEHPPPKKYVSHVQLWSIRIVGIGRVCNSNLTIKASRETECIILYCLCAVAFSAHTPHSLSQLSVDSISFLMSDSILSLVSSDKKAIEEIYTYSTRWGFFLLPSLSLSHPTIHELIGKAECVCARVFTAHNIVVLFCIVAQIRKTYFTFYGRYFRVFAHTRLTAFVYI